jgi:hypothetical protein
MLNALVLLLAAAQPAGVDPAAAAAIRDWTLCLTGSAERLTVAGAEADAVAAAAVAACLAEENAMLAAAASLPGAAPAESARPGLRSDARAFIANRTRQRLAAIARDPIEAANQAHGACIGERVGLEAASTSRPAAAIVEEALAACRPQEERLHAAVAAARGRAAADRLIGDNRRSGRESANALVADVRRRPAAR